MRPILDSLGSLTLIILVLMGATGMERNTFASPLLKHKIFWCLKGGEVEKGGCFMDSTAKGSRLHHCIAWERVSGLGLWFVEVGQIGGH